MADERDQRMIDYARKAARHMNSPMPQPGGALGNTADGRPDFDKGALPSNKTRPSFKSGGKVKNYCKGGKVISSSGR